MGAFRRSSLPTRILLGIVPFFFLFTAISVVLQNLFQEREMLEQAQNVAQVYAGIIKESLVSMMVSNLEVDERFLRQLDSFEQLDTIHIVVNKLRLRREVLEPEDSVRIAAKPRAIPDDLERVVLSTGTSVFSRTEDRIRAVIPFKATDKCRECHAVEEGYTLGAADMQISLADASESAAGNWTRSLVMFIIFTSAAVVAASLFLDRFIARPVTHLVEATDRISSGDLDFSINQQGARDEISVLAQRFDEMRLSLKEKITELDRLNSSLSVQNRDLEHAMRRLKEAQEELVRAERLATAGKMTAQLSHEINNPIHNIQSLVESTLRKVEPGSQAQELLTVALDEVGRIARLTRQMLDYSRGTLAEETKQKVSVRKVVDDVILMNVPTHARLGITVAVDISPRDLEIATWPDRLKQIILNLLLNAQDAMPDGGTITILGRRENSTLTLEVSDTGVGILPDHVGHVFDAFFTTKKQTHGAGLGLFVTYGLVQQLGGTIDVASNVGKGTMFTIQLPA